MCRNGKAKGEEKGEAKVELNHGDSNVGNECEDAGNSDGGEGRWDEGITQSGGGWILYSQGRRGKPMGDDRELMS